MGGRRTLEFKKKVQNLDHIIRHSEGVLCGESNFSEHIEGMVMFN